MEEIKATLNAGECLFLGDWLVVDWQGRVGRAALLGDFEIAESALEGASLLLAHYAIDYYEGESFVLFEKDGVLYEVNASHCSCYGLEGQWSPEETSIVALRHRLNEGLLGSSYAKKNMFGVELATVLDWLEERGAALVPDE